MSVSKLTPRTAVLVLSALLLLGCNSSDEDNDNSEGGNTTTGGGDDNLPTLSGLTEVPNNENWLYFTSNAENNAGLYAYNPQLPEEGAVLIDGEAYLSSSPYLFHPIAGATITGDTLADYRARTVFYRTKTEQTIPGTDSSFTVPNAFKRVDTTQSVTAATPEQVSSEANSSNLLSTQYFFQFDLDQPENTAIAYRGDAQWLQVRVGDQADQPPLAFNADHRLVAPLGDGDPNGWLVIDENNNNQLLQLDLNLTAEGAVLSPSGDPIQQLDHLDIFSHLGRNHQLVVLTFKDPDTSDQETPPSELWLYTAGHPGTIEPLLNAQDEKLEFSRNIFGQGASLPSAEQMVIRDQTLYFAFHERSDFSILGAFNPMLYRVDKNGWSLKIDYADQNESGNNLVASSPYLIDAGNHLLWLIDDTWTRINLADYSETALIEGSVETPIVDSANGWFFYNDERDIDTAVAASVDGTQNIRIEEAEWIGASSTGTGNVAIRLAKADISEVFLLKDDGTIAAVKAGSPDQGMVILGRLNPAPETVRMLGTRSGPHQLLQVSYEDDSAEVVYVNTHQANSLKHLMAEPSSQPGAGAQTRPVYGR